VYPGYEGPLGVPRVMRVLWVYPGYEPARVNPIKLAYDTRQPDGRPHRDQRL